MNPEQAGDWKNKILTITIEKGPKVLTAILIIIAGAMVARVLGQLAQRWLDKRKLEPPVRLLLTRVVKLVTFMLFVVVALGTVGIDTAPLIAGVGVAGVGIGLAMQGVLGNLVCGLLIIFTKPFRVGEYIEIIGVQGQVHTIDLFSTTLLHPDRSRVVVPNRKIVGEVLHNYGTMRQQEVKVGVAYNTDLVKALAVIRGVLERDADVLKEPAASVAVTNFGDSSIEISIRPWTELKNFAEARADLHLSLAEAFRSNAIEIAYPQREVRVINEAASGALRSL